MCCVCTYTYVYIFHDIYIPSLGYFSLFVTVFQCYNVPLNILVNVPFRHVLKFSGEYIEKIELQGYKGSNSFYVLIIKVCFRESPNVHSKKNSYILKFQLR